MRDEPPTRFLLRNEIFSMMRLENLVACAIGVRER
jgi:hypothetical protein